MTDQTPQHKWTRAEMYKFAGIGGGDIVVIIPLDWDTFTKHPTFYLEEWPRQYMEENPECAELLEAASVRMVAADLYRPDAPND